MAYSTKAALAYCTACTKIELAISSQTDTFTETKCFEDLKIVKQEYDAAEVVRDR